MFTSKHYINLFSLASISLINLLFIIKFSLFYINVPVVFTLIFLFLFLFIIISIDRSRILWNIFSEIRPRNNIFLFLILAAFLILLFVLNPVTSANLLAGRFWLSNLFHGIFPYSSVNFPYSFPFSYFITLPFYIIGEVSLTDLAGWLVFSWLLISRSVSLKEKIIRMLIILAGPLLFYGMIDSGGLLLNIVLLIILIVYSHEKLNIYKAKKLSLIFVVFAILFGLILSTHFEMIPVLIIYFLFLFRQNLRAGLLFTITSAIIFLMTILPFLLWNADLFLTKGPFNYLFNIWDMNWWFIIAMCIISIYIGWVVSDIQEIFFSSACVLFLPLLVNISLRILKLDFFNVLAYEYFDLNKFVICLPFFLLSIKDYKIQKFAGKLLSSDHNLL